MIHQPGLAAPAEAPSLLGPLPAYPSVCQSVRRWVMSPLLPLPLPQRNSRADRSIGLGARLAMPVALEKRRGGARPAPFPPPARGARTAARAGGYSSPSPLPCEAMVSAGRAGPGCGVFPVPPSPQCLYVCAPLPEKEPRPQPAG